MAESVKFSEGVSRLEGTSLNAPWDLRNAYIKPTHIVEALNSPSEETGIVDLTYGEEIRKHHGQWVKSEASDYFRSILYTSGRAPERIRVYPENQTTPEKDVPRITAVDETASSDALNENRLVMYVLIPVNGRGEAGVWRYHAWNTGTGGNLPILGLQATDQTQYVEVYRTAEMRESVEDGGEPAQALHYLGRFSGSTSASDAEQYYTSIPHVEAGELPSQYYDSDVEYIYLSSKKEWDNTAQRDDVDFIGKDLNGWSVVFTELHEDNDLSVDTEYFVAATNDYSLDLEDSNGNPLTFSSKEVLKQNTQVINFVQQVESYTGVSVNLTPPDDPTSTGSDITVVDRKQWSYDSPDDSDEVPNMPETRILERDRTLHGRSRLAKSASVDTAPDPDEFTISGEDVTRFFPEDTIFRYEPDTSILVSAAGEGAVFVGGSVTFTTQSVSFTVTLNSLTEETNGDVTAAYTIDGGTSSYDVSLKRRASGTSSFGEVNTATESSDGDKTIADTTPPNDGTYGYRVDVTDDGGGTVESNVEFIYLSGDEQLQ